MATREIQRSKFTRRPHSGRAGKVHKVVENSQSKKEETAGYGTFGLREVQNCKLAVVFFSGTVVGLGGPDLVIERAEEYPPAVDPDFCLPELVFAVPGDTLVLGAVGSVLVFASVLDVLGNSSWSQICLSIIQAVAVNVVNNHIMRDLEYTTVHGKLTLSSVSGSDTPCGIKSSAHFDGTPSVFGELAVIIGVNDGILTLGQGYAAEGVAVAEPAIQKKQPNERCQKPAWYFESDADDPPSCVCY